MMTEKKLEANRHNALLSTGPKTGEGVLACKNNALRHGLRALKTVVPGEDPDEWEIHRGAVVADLRPEGVVEFALAEDVAVKLWRLGRVVRYETDLIANAQDEDEVVHAHESSHGRMTTGSPGRTNVPTWEDVTKAKRAMDKAEEKLAEVEAALRTLEGLTEMQDEDRIEDWSIFEPLKNDLGLEADQTDDLFEDEDAPFVARHVRAMLRMRGAVDEITDSMATHWRDTKIPELRGKADTARKAHQELCRRYEAALDRRRRAHGLPRPDDLDRIQRYEAHLERGLHKALDRLRDLQEGRGAVPPRGPSVALAVIQAGRGEPAEALVGPFGSFALTGQAAGQECNEGGAERYLVA